MSKKQKRTLKAENRLFNEEWELQYFLISSNDKMVCLLCSTVITTIKKYNANQHYMTHSNHKYAILEGEARETILQQLKKEKLHQQQTFNKFFQQNNNATEARYKVAYILGKRGKPFSDVEMIKDCIVEVVKCLHPEKVDKYKQLPLSRGTITERQHELATNIKQQFCKIIKEENIYFSIALDESTDNTDSAQVLFFIRAITEDFRCFEELLALGTLSGGTRGKDFLENFKIKICEAGLNINNLVSVCTDGAPAIVGKREGFISLLKKEYANLEKLISFHCILHQQNLCAKSASLNDTLEKNIVIVNFIRSSSMRHRQFRDIIMSDNDTFNGDLPYHSKISWISRGQGLLKIFTLCQQIIKFFEEQKKYCDLSDKEFCRNAAFLCDMTMKQN
uniref:General transcription factor II-I repeat domain-containing protein 2A-like n=1 Tax=Diabrotica virgifera virgifera TaxID=50390 RepID=A0A6P7F1W9_DIAVI